MGLNYLVWNCLVQTCLAALALICLAQTCPAQICPAQSCLPGLDWPARLRQLISRPGPQVTWPVRVWTGPLQPITEPQ